MFGWLHRHNWRGSAWNPYMVEHEQVCSCGEHRHRFLDANRRVAQGWLPGEHPKARHLRGVSANATAQSELDSGSTRKTD